MKKSEDPGGIMKEAKTSWRLLSSGNRRESYLIAPQPHYSGGNPKCKSQKEIENWFHHQPPVAPGSHKGPQLMSEILSPDIQTSSLHTGCHHAAHLPWDKHWDLSILLSAIWLFISNQQNLPKNSMWIGINTYTYQILCCFYSGLVWSVCKM